MKKLTLIFLLTFTLVAFISCESKDQKIERLAEAASKALDAKDYPTALEKYTEIKSIDTLYPKMDCMIGVTQYLLGNKNEAFNSLKLAIKKDSSDKDPLYFLGQILMERKEYNEAIEKLEVYIETRNEAHPNFIIGSCYLGLNKPAKSIKYFNQAIHLNPNDSHWWWSRSLANLLIQDLDQALFDCNKAIELNNVDPEYYHTRASIHFILEDTESACEDYKNAIIKGFSRDNDMLEDLCSNKDTNPETD